MFTLFKPFISNVMARSDRRDFPEPADLLNKLKARRKISKTSLGDVEAILEILSAQL